MHMRNKLIIYFACFVMITLVAFGLATFRIVQEGVADRDVNFFSEMAHIQTEELSSHYQHEESIPHLVEHLHSHSTDQHILLLLDANLTILNPEFHTPQSQPDYLQQAMLQLQQDSSDKGKFDLGEQHYVWIKSAFGTSGLFALHIYTSVDYTRLYQSKLIKRLVVVALVIFWIGVWGALIISTIITRRINEQQQKIEYQASHDMMTGLQNRNYLAAKIDQIIKSNHIPSLSVIIIGINRFREINNTLGHDFGDLLLKEFSIRLKQEFWSDDTIARFGSDQYALILPLSDQNHWKVVIDKIEKILRTPFSIQGMQISSDVSIGVSIYPTHGNTAVQLLRCAEVGMYSAKKSGTFYEIYDSAKDPNSVDRLQLISELTRSIEQNELELHFQPKYAINGTLLIGCESLLRWNNPGRGRIPPDVFIPLAEQGSFIKHLSAWVFDQAIQHCAEWHRAGCLLSISVNLSARLLIENEIVDLVAHYLKKHGLEPQFLILEITESAMMVDPVRARAIMEQLVKLGVHLSIDDFGTGYTSISQIQTMPVTEIKIDKSFVLNMQDKPSDATLVKLIIDMGHGMGHKVTAEGIENQAVLDELKNMGCDIAQGYFLGRPMPLAEFNQVRLRALQQNSINTDK